MRKSYRCVRPMQFLLVNIAQLIYKYIYFFLQIRMFLWLHIALMLRFHFNLHHSLCNMLNDKYISNYYLDTPFSYINSTCHSVIHSSLKVGYYFSHNIIINIE